MKHKKITLFIIVLLVFTLFDVCAWHKVGCYSGKLWLHRCNSLEKMKEKENLYPNIEVDLVYRGNGVFDVTHDADTTFGLKVDSYFKEIGETDRHMWLDIKNVNRWNVDSMYQDLDSICDCYDVDSTQLIIEGGDYDALETFTDGGYYTSYYVPFDKPRRLSDEQIDSCIVKLRKIADSKKVCALSFPGFWYKEIKSNLHRNIDLLTWKNHITQVEFMKAPYRDKMLKDKQLKVILIKSKGKYHR